MRVSPCQAALGAACALNLLLLLRVWRPPRPAPRCAAAPPLSPGVTVVLRDFEDAAHDVAATARSFAAEAPVLIVTETPPYPPLPPLPPGARLVTPAHAARWLRTRHVALGRAPARCVALRVDARAWTARYAARGPCGAVRGAAVLLLRTRDLLALPLPLARPLPAALFLQAARRGWRARLVPQAAFGAAPMPPMPTARAQAARRHRALAAALGVKRVVLAGGGERWFGCGKRSARCFGSLRAGAPRYLLRGRWTPPCCLRALRATALRVTRALRAAGARFWLEGGSLLGAARRRDILPWDYDVDMGIYKEDVPKCPLLRAAAARGAVEDDEGFLWEKAAEGEFFRVHFSRSNRLHVDLWPFYSRGGVMTKDTWLGHRQDTEFPERLLLPLATLPFAGFRAPVPGHVRSFLEFKFGAGALEHAEYPNPELRSLRGHPAEAAAANDSVGTLPGDAGTAGDLGEGAPDAALPADVGMLVDMGDVGDAGGLPGDAEMLLGDADMFPGDAGLLLGDIDVEDMVDEDMEALGDIGDMEMVDGDLEDWGGPEVAPGW
ncbi:ribitol 5-phosphate transferase FKRP [Eudromia elegans]